MDYIQLWKRQLVLKLTRPQDPRSGNDVADFGYAKHNVSRPNVCGGILKAFVFVSRSNSYSDHPLEKAPSWSSQLQSTSVVKAGQENKVPHHTPIKVEGTPQKSQVALQPTRDQNYKPFVIQTTSGSLPSIHQPLQDMETHHVLAMRLSGYKRKVFLKDHGSLEAQLCCGSDRSSVLI
ncbi:hypothetical protein HHK36_023573 [Tetracentron sinense]|uniref:Uncharacterized protein n=1 Tax=Tetracentron sinense TaxID=13715 RepID=A0A834YQI3_TETSI|nr:hypothetical protein HHK36_023573 [Tetracentron sinense]